MDKILIVSDTHGDIETLEKVLRKEKKFNYLFHLGDHHNDIDDVDFDLTNVEIKKVRGNCDFMKETEEIFFELNGKKIFMTHGHLYGVKNSYSSIFYKACEIGADIVLFGHTHEKLNINMSGVHLFNPGTLSMRGYGKRSYGIMEIDEKGNYKITHKYI